MSYDFQEEIRDKFGNRIQERVVEETGMVTDDGYHIHGGGYTGDENHPSDIYHPEDNNLYTDSTWGCIRMNNDDVRELIPYVDAAKYLMGGESFMLIKKHFSLLMLLILCFCQSLFSEDVLSVYSYNPLDGGVNLVEIIDFGFYEDGLLKYIITYQSGPNIHSCEDDDGERSDLKIMWQYPQYFVEREADDRIVLKLRRYNSDGELVKEETERYLSIQDDNHYLTWLEDSDSGITVQVGYEYLSSIFLDGEYKFYVSDDHESIRYAYSYGKNYYNYFYSDDKYTEYDYYHVSDKSSRWQYEIDYDSETAIYNIESYDPSREERLYEDRYVIKRTEIEMTPIIGSINYFLFSGNLVLLPFVTRTVITQPEE